MALRLARSSLPHVRGSEPAAPRFVTRAAKEHRWRVRLRGQPRPQVGDQHMRGFVRFPLRRAGAGTAVAAAPGNKGKTRGGGPTDAARRSNHSSIVVVVVVVVAVVVVVVLAQARPVLRDTEVLLPAVRGPGRAAADRVVVRV